MKKVIMILSDKSTSTSFPLLSFLIIILSIGFQQSTFAQGSSHEYAELTRERVEESLAAGATKADLALAEGSLTALGWFVIYGNDEASVQMARKLNEVPSDLYNGTANMDLIYMDFTSDAYAEMLNLNRFDSNKPVSMSQDLANYAKSQVAKAIAQGTSDGDKTLIEAEGSLMGLGWLTAYGNENKTLSDKMEDVAYKIANDVYSIHNRGYQIMRNFHYWKMDSKSASSSDQRFTDLGDHTVLDNTTNLVWMKNPSTFTAYNWEDAMAQTAALEAGFSAGTWRLPTNKEWKTMVPSGRSAAESGLFSVDWEQRYWSSTTPSNDFGAYHIGIWGDGGIDFDGRNTLRYLWPVRDYK